jgi:hypothetical protein
LTHNLASRVEIRFNSNPRETAEVMATAEAMAAINKFQLSI